MTEDEVRLLIICSHVVRIQPVQNYLQRRGWGCAVTDNLKEGLSIITSQKPSHVLLSWDLPKNNPVKTEEIIRENFNTPCIVFTESPDATKLTHMAATPFRHVILGQATGPSVHTKISNILRSTDEYSPGAGIGRRSYEEIVVKISDVPLEGFWEPTGKSDSVGRPEWRLNFPGQSRHKNMAGIYIFRGQTPPMYSADRGWDHNEYAGSLTFLPRAETTTQSSIAREAPLTGKEFNVTQEASKQNNFALTQEAPKANISTFYESKIVVKGTPTALSESSFNSLREASAPDPKPPQTIKDTRKVVVIAVRSERHNGFLIMASATEQTLSKNFISTVKHKLAGFLRKRGESIECEEQLDVEIESVDFLAWAKEYSEFLATSQHGADEVGMAFLTGKEVIAQSELTHEKDMVAIDTKDLLPEVVLNFNVYLFLRNNQRYVAYVTSGQYLSVEQMKKLTGYKMTKLFIKATDLMPFKSYCAANFINASIRDYKNKKAA